MSRKNDGKCRRRPGWKETSRAYLPSQAVDPLTMSEGGVARHGSRPTSPLMRQGRQIRLGVVRDSSIPQCEDIAWDAGGPSMGSPRGQRGEASGNSESRELVSLGLRPYQIRKDTRKGAYVPIGRGPAGLRTTALHDVAGIVATQCVAVHSCSTDRRPWDRHDGVEHSVSTASANAAMPTAPYPASSHRRRTASAWTLVWRLRARCRKRRSAAPPPRQ